MAVGMSPDEVARHIGVLNASTDREDIAVSAVALAASADRDALLGLARALRRKEFLDRLDDTADPDTETQNLLPVFRTLAAHPSEYGARLCVLIYAEPDFTAIPARINFLLNALAAVRPTTEDAARVFRETSREGYVEVIAPLLIENESPLALQLFEETVGADWLESYVKVSILHYSVLPRRTRMAVLITCAHLLQRPLPDEVRTGLLESIFDYKSRLWFGPAMSPPMPPTWESAETEVIEFVHALASHVLSDLSGTSLAQAIRNTQQEVAAILRGRAP